MSTLNIEEKDKILEEPLVDFNFNNEWDDESEDSDFQIDNDEDIAIFVKKVGKT